ncbi:MAG: aminopeptidase [Blastocatellia bacterium]|jgi:aminopeptidase N|nr:aminopeptidase [Blastocatellia bacterium]
MNKITTLRLIFIMMFLMMCGALHGAPVNGSEEPSAGVARELARFRAAHYSDVHYELHLQVAAKAQMMTGLLIIRVTLDGELDQLVLDWRVAAAKEGQPQARVWNIRANNRPVNDARTLNDHILIAGAYLHRGENILQLEFESPMAASGSAVTRYTDREDGSEYIYTLFVPSDASTAFPCFDQPDLKARFKLNITTPAAWKVVTNSLMETHLSNSSMDLDQKYRTINRGFRETQPISTYLFAFAAGPFAEFKDESSAIALRLFVRRSKAERARKELAEVFRLNREGLKFLAGYFDNRFPFPKYDVVILPEFAYGGMEHAGATFLREETILFPSDPTASDLLNRAETILHEAAHQWFGDLVTMRWFDDLWLKEGFATFMAYKAMEELLPQYNAWKVFYQRTKPSAYLTDVTKGTTPIFQEIANLSAAKSAYGNIVYRKAPSMLRQAEFFLGPEKFQGAVRLFLKEHAYGNAEWADLVRAFERTSGRKLDAWAAAWVKRRGMPDVRAEWSVGANGRINRFVLRERDALEEGGSWPMRVKVLLVQDKAPPDSITVNLEGAGETNVREAIGKRRPAYVFANASDYGYGRFLLDDVSQKVVLAQLGTVKDDFLRALLWGALWDSVREAQLAPSDYIELGLKLVQNEKDDVVAQSILSRMGSSYNRYLSREQRESVAPRLERTLEAGMMNALTAGLRITYFRAFQSIATTEEARSVLKKILSGELKIPGMTLRTRDRFDIITALMARGDLDAPRLLEEQSAADKTDDARRYAYAAGAARAEQENKKKYFEAYLNDKQLAESWIEASLGPFNAIEQDALTLQYLEPALEELPALKRTRKIFFVNGWLAAFVGGQCSADALKVVQNFLARESGLDRDLRLKVLEVTDGLERCVRIRSKYADKRGADKKGS